MAAHRPDIEHWTLNTQTLSIQTWTEIDRQHPISAINAQTWKDDTDIYLETPLEHFQNCNIEVRFLFTPPGNVLWCIKVSTCAAVLFMVANMFAKVTAERRTVCDGVSSKSHVGYLLYNRKTVTRDNRNNSLLLADNARRVRINQRHNKAPIIDLTIRQLNEQRFSNYVRGVLSAKSLIYHICLESLIN